MRSHDKRTRQISVISKEKNMVLEGNMQKASDSKTLRKVNPGLNTDSHRFDEIFVTYSNAKMSTSLQYLSTFATNCTTYIHFVSYSQRGGTYGVCSFRSALQFRIANIHTGHSNCNKQTLERLR